MPGARRANTYTQYVSRFVVRSGKPGITPRAIIGCMVIGTYTMGSMPSVVPSNPFGATPMTVIDCPLIMICCPTTFGSEPRSFCQ